MMNYQLVLRDRREHRKREGNEREEERGQALAEDKARRRAWAVTGSCMVFLSFPFLHRAQAHILFFILLPVEPSPCGDRKRNKKTKHRPGGPTVTKHLFSKGIVFGP